MKNIGVTVLVFTMSLSWIMPLLGKGNAALHDNTHAKPETLTIAYTRHWGDKTQLRIRTFPFPGTDTLLWESPSDKYGYLKYQPSKSASHIAVVWRRDFGSAYTLFVINIKDGQVQEVEEKPAKTELVVWKNESTLSWINRDGAEWEFNINSKELKHTVDHGEMGRGGGRWDQVKPFVTHAFRKDIQILNDLLTKKTDLHKLFPVLNDIELESDIEIDAALEVVPAVIRNAGIFVGVLSGIPISAAVSPDGKFAAITLGTEPLFILDAVSGVVKSTIRFTKLVEGETVSARDLHWTADSTKLLFTEQHYHPAGYNVADLGHPPDPLLDFTSLVRIYNSQNHTVHSVLVGGNAFIIQPEGKNAEDVNLE